MATKTGETFLYRDGKKDTSPLQYLQAYATFNNTPDAIGSYLGLTKGKGPEGRAAYSAAYNAAISDPARIQKALEGIGLGTAEERAAFESMEFGGPASGRRAGDPGSTAGVAETKMVNGVRVNLDGTPAQQSNVEPPATPIRMPGEAIEDFTKRIDPKSYQMTPEEAAGGQAGIQAYNARIASPQGNLGQISGASIGSGTPTLPTSPAVATSTALRAKERATALKDALGLGQSPTLPDIFGSTDQKSLNLARQERDTINTELEGILNERIQLQEEFRKFQSNAGKGTTEAGRQGIVSEEGRKIQEQFDVLNRRELVLETKLGNRNGVIKELMGLQQQEYADAVSQYNTQFSQALQIYNLFDKEDDELKSNAKANLEVLSNSIKAQVESGQLSPDQITSVQRRQLEELELQSGLPTGSTLAVLQSLKPGEEKLYSGVDDFGNFVYITRNAQGVINTKKVPGAVPQKPTGGGGNNTTPSPGSTPAKNNKILSSLGLPLTVADSKGGLTQSALNKVVKALGEVGAQPALDIAVGIWRNIIAGNSLEEIRTGLAGEYGRNDGYEYLDTFMQTLQGETRTF